MIVLAKDAAKGPQESFNILKGNMKPVLPFSLMFNILLYFPECRYLLIFIKDMTGPPEALW